MGLRNNDNWSERQAIIFTRNHNISMLLKELLRSQGWNVTQSTDSVPALIANVAKGFANLIVIDDEPNYPAVCVQRQLLANPIAALTPTLCFVADQNTGEVKAMGKIGSPVIVNKPLTPNRFIPKLQQLMRTWSEGFYFKIRQATKDLLEDNLGDGLKALTTLTENTRSQTLVAPTLSLYYRNNGNVQTAEKILLSALKTTRLNLGLIMALVDLYLHTAMPYMAMRLIKGAEMAYEGSRVLHADKMQAELMLGNLDGVVEVLKNMQSDNQLVEKTDSFLMRTLFSDGRDHEFTELIETKARAKKFAAMWEEEKPSRVSGAA